jgi:prepilin-type N-terminal cleavage/methylation domain-containing protein
MNKTRLWNHGGKMRQANERSRTIFGQIRRSRHGYSLTETLVALLLMSIIATLFFSFYARLHGSMDDGHIQLYEVAEGLHARLLKQGDALPEDTLRYQNQLYSYRFSLDREEQGYRRMKLTVARSDRRKQITVTCFLPDARNP